MASQPEPLLLPIRDLPRFRDLNAFPRLSEAPGSCADRRAGELPCTRSRRSNRRVIAEMAWRCCSSACAGETGVVSLILLLDQSRHGRARRLGLGVEARNLPASPGVCRTARAAAAARPHGGLAGSAGARRARWPRETKRAPVQERIFEARRTTRRRCRCSSAGRGTGAADHPAAGADSPARSLPPRMGGNLGVLPHAGARAGPRHPMLARPSGGGAHAPRNGAGSAARCPSPR